MHNVVIELIVNNHPGVMSHITGLFARRAFNIEGILCGPIAGGGYSRIYLLVDESQRLPQVTSQLEKLYDIQTVTVRPDYDQTLFHRLHEFGDQELEGMESEASS